MIWMSDWKGRVGDEKFVVWIEEMTRSDEGLDGLKVRTQ